MSTHRTGHLIIYKVYNDFADAGFAQVKLRDAGIESFLEDENVIGFNPTGGVELKIFETDAAKAAEILGDQ